MAEPQPASSAVTQPPRRSAGKDFRATYNQYLHMKRLAFTTAVRPFARSVSRLATHKQYMTTICAPVLRCLDEAALAPALSIACACCPCTGCYCLASSKPGQRKLFEAGAGLASARQTSPLIIQRTSDAATQLQCRFLGAQQAAQLAKSSWRIPSWGLPQCTSCFA